MQALHAKKLLIVVNDAAFFLSHRRNIAQAATSAGMEVSICCPNDPGAAEIERLGFTRHSIELSRWGANPLREIATIKALFRLYRRVRPDVVHHVTIKPVIYGSLAAKAAGVPAIVNAISGLGQVFTSSGPKAVLRRTAVKFLYRCALGGPRVRVIFQNDDDRRAFLDAGLISAERTILVRGAGVDLASLPMLPQAEGMPTVLFASRLLREKGIHEFVAAAEQLRGRATKAQFLIAGAPVPGNPGSISAEQYETWKRGGVVECLGYQNDISVSMKRAHIVCLPSYYGEGVPKILIEAAAAGRAIVTTDWPGCRDIVRHGHNGLLVEPRDSTALADALQKLLENPQLRSEFGSRGRARVEQEGFDEATVVRQTLELYASLLPA